MKIAIIGAGLTGLTAGFRLSQKGHKVVIFEKNSFAGGLASGFKEKNWSFSLEHFYHHIFTSDKAFIELIQELKLNNQLFFIKPKTSIFYKNQIFQFDDPFSLLRFPFLSFLDKLRTGTVTLFLKINPFFKFLEKETAVSWLKKYYGQKSFMLLWEPLLKSKFGQKMDQISMAWFWARIKKRSSRLGYLEGGFQILINALVKDIEKRGGKFYFNYEVQNLNDLYRLGEFDRVIFTGPARSFAKLVPEFPPCYRNSLQKFEMLGALNLILISKEQFLKDGTYWLNINDSSFPFVAAVEHTNFIDKKYYGGNHILYVGGYYPQNHRFFKMGKEQIFKEFLPYLKKINPDSQLLITNCYLFKNQFAQPIIPVNYSRILLPHQTPSPRVFLANIEQVYPWDRGTNYAIELGEKITRITA